MAEVRRQLTPAVRQCVLLELGKEEAKRLLAEAKESQEIPPEALPALRRCLPSTNNQPTPSPTPVTLTSGVSLGAGVLIGQKGLKELCPAIQQYGSKFNWLTLSWARIQPAGPNQWVWKQFDTWVDGYRSCGQEVGVHILSDANWATEPRPENVRGMPPKDLNQYATFVSQVAKHYQGRITRYSIENEAHADSSWGGTPEEYISELQTAYKAIHTADPSAIVEDAGMSHEGLGYLTTIWLYQKGEVQPAIDFANAYVAHFYKGLSNPPVIDEATIADWLTKPGIQKTLHWEDLLFQNEPYYDRMQIHNGAPWPQLSLVLDYLHTNLQAHGADKSIDLWEGWCSWTGAPENGFDPQAQAREIVKQVVTAFAGKVAVYNYWTFTDFAIKEGHPGLVDNQGQARPAATAYKITSEKLTGATSVERLSLGANIYGYQFSLGAKNVYVVWATTKTSATLPLTGSATVTDISGNTATVSSNIVSVSDSPIFVEE